MKYAAAAAAFLAVLALSPPVDALADRSFAWHMVQHLVLLFFVPLGILLSRPFDVFRALAGDRAAAAAVRATRLFHVVATPPVAFCAFTATLWATHFSGLYDAALGNGAIHAAEHAIYLSAGLLFWLPVLTVPPLRPSGHPLRLFYLMVSLPQGAFVAMVVASARAPLYAHYAGLVGRAQALADQQAAAAVMWVGGGLIVFAALIATLASWARQESKASQARA
ncbi:MAG: cytochrome c oxidase assembly protein [Candidatus Eremiobacteraeota bacterium]|nr:cytochrome c oxidase assembly protein [Candidatus Eremiobacteraeota bacterium]